MQIAIHALDFSMTTSLRKHAERRLRLALTSYDEHIQRIVMRLSSNNGAAGGTGRCQLQVSLAGVSDVVIEDIESDLYVAIGRAATRAGRTVRRRLARRRDRSRMTGLHGPTLDA